MHRSQPSEVPRPQEQGAGGPAPPDDPQRHQATGSFSSTPSSGAGGPVNPGAVAEAGPAAPPADTVGAYELLEEIARGGMGIVYKARHRQLGRVVALKTTRPDIAMNQQHALRFEREMQAAARLRHPNIVTIYEVGLHAGRPFYTMPFIPEGNLAQHRQRLAAEPSRAVRLVATVARALQHAHEQGILHRDLKPSNVLLDRGEPLVSDFGLAKLMGGDVELTETGQVLGTPSYMAPEQAAGRVRDIGPATDIWALGVMLYELLAKQRPFVGESSDEVKMKILLEHPVPLRQVRDTIPEPLERVVLRCLEKEPSRRYPSAAALADELDGCLAGTAETASGAQPRRQRMTLRRRLVLTAALVLLAAGLSLGALALRDHVPAQEAEAAPASIVYIGNSGPPPLIRWVVGEKGASIVQAGSDELFTVHADSLALLELAPAPPWEDYRLEAEICQKAGQRLEAGVYATHGRYQCTPGTSHVFLSFGYADRGDFLGRRSFSVSRFDDWKLGAQTGASLGDSFFHVAAPHEVGSWRGLALEVSGGEARAFWGTQCIASAPWDSVNRKTAQVLQPLQLLHREHPPRTGLGLIVQGGDFSFRHVVLRHVK
jgi:tRNA A-37 threonylcarbamoyl transferase component Bud32